MNGFVVKYKKAGWSTWVNWPCKSRDEYAHIKKTLREEGYIVLEDGIEYMPKTLQEVIEEPSEKADYIRLRYERWLSVHHPYG